MSIINPELINKINQLTPEEQPEPFLRYIGGKANIAKVLLPHVPWHDIYVEPFVGSGAFFFKKDKAKSSILNDFNGDLTNLYMQIRDNVYYIINWIWHTPFSEQTHRRIFQAYRQPKVWTALPAERRACGYFYMLQLAYNESVGNLSHPAVQYNTGNHKWNQEALVEQIWHCSHKIHHNVYIQNKSYIGLISEKRINKENTFFYFDPPYTMASDKKYYRHNFLPRDHFQFKMVCDQVKGKLLISYDPHPLVLQLFNNNRYFIYDVPGFKNEVAITNYETELPVCAKL